MQNHFREGLHWLHLVHESAGSEELSSWGEGGGSTGLGPNVAPATLRLAIFSVVGVFSMATGFGVFTGLG
jgi:hypothetical protein